MFASGGQIVNFNVFSAAFSRPHGQFKLDRCVIIQNEPGVCINNRYFLYRKW